MIITEATSIDRNNLPTHTIEAVDNATVDDYRRAGRIAGDTAGRQMKIAFGPSSNADFSKFQPALKVAIESACAHMQKHGANKEKIAAWRLAFSAALKPHLDQFEALQKLLGKV